MTIDRLIHIARRRRYVAIWAIGALAALLVMLGAFSPYSPVERLNFLVFDTYQKLKPRDPTPSAVAVLDIDDESIRQLGQWPWPRTVLAGMIDRLTEMGASAIGMDIVFSEPDRTSPALAVAQLENQGFQVTYPGAGQELDHDRILAQAFGRSPSVTGLVLAETITTPPPPPKAGFAFGGDNPLTYLTPYPGSVRNLAILDEAAPGLGVFSFPPALDGVVRQIPLLSRFGDRLYPALSIETLRVAQGASSYVVRSTGAAGELASGNPGMVALQAGQFEMPTAADGSIWVYYTSDLTSPVIPAHRLVGDIDPEVQAEVEGRIILFGTSAIGLRDLVSTPLGQGVPGVTVHAEIIDQIIAGVFISRPDWAAGLEVVAAVALTLFVLALLPWLSTSANVLALAVALAVAIGGGWFGFSRHALLLSPILPAASCFAAFAAASGMRLLLSESESRYIRSAFSHYLSPAMVQRLVESPQNLVLGGENRELTLLFCDLRSFTSISETMKPDELTHFLNEFLTPMTDVLLRNGATIDKYIGDAIMAFWNAPLDVEDHRQKAAESVLMMLAALDRLNETLPRPISVGIGLNTGICCVGNLGSRQRFDYSAIGDPVNVASRIEGLTKQYGLSNLMAGSTANGVSHLALVEIDRVMVVGRDEPTTLFTLLGNETTATSDDFVAFRQLHDRFLENYRSQHFDKAAVDLEKLREPAPSTLAKVYALYAARLQRFAVEPPPPDWDGSHRAESK